MPRTARSSGRSRPDPASKASRITWEQDGEQYVAVSVGVGGVYSLFSGDERMASIPPGGSLWAFKLMQ